MGDEPTGASLNASQRSVLSGISKDPVALRALKTLEGSGCVQADLVRLLNAAVTFRTLREGRLAKEEEPWGLPDGALRQLPKGMRDLASRLDLLHQSGLGQLDHLRRLLKELDANGSIPPEFVALNEPMVNVIAGLPVILRWYAGFLDKWRLYGRGHRSFRLRLAAECSESALSAYVKNRTGSPHWEEVSRILASAYDSATKGEPIGGRRKAGDSSILYEVENLRKRVARLNEEAAAIVAGGKVGTRPDNPAKRNTSRKSGTRKR